jgi:phage terminase small subunit
MARRKVSQEGTGEKSPGETAPPSVEPSNLKPSHEKFCREYARTSNGRLSYKAAYPDASLATASVEANRLLKNPNILEFIEVVKDLDNAEINFTRRDALLILVDIAKNGSEKGKVAATIELWDKLGLGEDARKGNWFDGFEHLAGLVRGTEKKK